MTVRVCDVPETTCLAQTRRMGSAGTHSLVRGLVLPALDDATDQKLALGQIGL